MYLTTAPAFVGIVEVGITRMMPVVIWMQVRKGFRLLLPYDLIMMRPARVLKVLLDVVLLPTAAVVAQLYSHCSTTTKFSANKVNSEIFL